MFSRSIYYQLNVKERFIRRLDLTLEKRLQIAFMALKVVREYYTIGL